MTSSSDSPQRDIERIQALYRRREREGEFWDFRTFHQFEPQIYFTESLFRDHLLDILRLEGFDAHRADEATVLEIGCGWGRNLYAFLEAGFRAEHISGVDLMEHFIERGRLVNPSLRIRAGNAAALTEPSGSIDIVLCHTVLSAILDEQLHRQVIGEALRVLKPGGLFVVFDIVPGYHESSARTADGREAVFIRPVAPETVMAYAGDRARPTYLRRVGLRQPFRAATFHGWLGAIGRKLRLSRPSSRRPRHYTARAFFARALGAVPMLRTHFILALKRTESS